MLLADEGAGALHEAGTRRAESEPKLSLEPVGDDTAMEAHVYLHPGRALVGTVSLRRAREQFDLSRARAYESLGRAELAADGQPGLLIDITGVFSDGEGRRYSHVTFFVPRSSSKLPGEGF